MTEVKVFGLRMCKVIASEVTLNFGCLVSICQNLEQSATLVYDKNLRKILFGLSYLAA